MQLSINKTYILNVKVLNRIMHQDILLMTLLFYIILNQFVLCIFALYAHNVGWMRDG